MIRIFLTLLTIPLVVTGTLGAAHAVPTCGSDVLASYIAFGAEGCNFGHVNFSNFVYVGETATGQVIGPADVNVFPHTGVDLGSGSGLEFSSFPGAAAFTLAFDARGVGGFLRGAQLELGFVDFTGPSQEATIFAAPGLVVDECSGGLGCFFSHGQSRDSVNFPPVAQVQFALEGFSEGNGIVSFDVAAVTPEPATLALWGLGAAGLGLARWRRGREHKD